MDRRILFILFLILLIGTFLRIRELDKDLLWQDEGEVAIYAKQILSSGFAYEYYRGIQFYVSPLIPEKADSVMYEYKQRDFRDGLAVYHPLADAYLTAVSFFLLGTSTFAARLPFALLGVASIFLVYKLGKFLYNTRVGLFASILQAMNVGLIIFERQCRYYSLGIFGFLATIYFSLRAFETNNIKDYLVGSAFFVLLFYSQPVIAVIAMVVLVLYNLIKGNYKIFHSKNCLVSLIIIFVFLTPYVFIIRPWELQGLYSNSILGLIYKLLILPPFIDYNIDIGSIPFLISIIFLFYRRNSSDKFIILSWVVYVAITLLLTPNFSFNPRSLIQMLPTFFIAIASMVDFVYGSLKKIGYELRLVLILSFILFIILFPYLLSFKPKFSIPLYDFLTNKEIEGAGDYIKTSSAWISDVTALLKRENVSSEWVFTTYQNAPLLFYTNYKVQLIWPIKKEFLEAYKERFWVVIDPESNNHCWWFNFYIKDLESICKNRNYQEVVKKCKGYGLDNNLTMYKCN